MAQRKCDAKKIGRRRKKEMIGSEKTTSVSEPDRKAVMRRQNIVAVRKHWQLYLLLLLALVYIIFRIPDSDYFCTACQ